MQLAIDREALFNLETGSWKNQHGKESYGIDAYWDTGDALQPQNPRDW
jgi:hypothetical protein